ncbi:MAG: leucine-rich repeat domain-containing protein [Treponema sp.]|nr:leucine-rich repeat domain-containing protein [Treponema sp.]
MKKMAKVAAMLAALALLFGAIGCSSGGSDEPSYEEPPITGDDVDPSRPPSSGGDVDPVTGGLSGGVPQDDMNWITDGNGVLCEYVGSDTDLTIPSFVTSIGYEAFKGNEDITSIKFSGVVKAIEQSAFEGCSSLKSITLPEGLEKIGPRAFYKCVALEDRFNIPEGVTEIWEQAFRECSNITTITLPVSLRKIDKYAFFDCKSLVKLIYAGTREQWFKVDLGEYWTFGTLVGTDVTTSDD